MAPTRVYNERRLMQPTAYVVYGIRMRHCYYCACPTATAFYLPAPIRGWACAACYTEHVIVPAVQPKQANCATVMALPEHVDAGLAEATAQGPQVGCTNGLSTTESQVAITQSSRSLVGVPSPVNIMPSPVSAVA